VGIFYCKRFTIEHANHDQYTILTNRIYLQWDITIRKTHIERLGIIEHFEHRAFLILLLGNSSRFSTHSIWQCITSLLYQNPTCELKTINLCMLATCQLQIAPPYTTLPNVVFELLNA
jgi:hypothetical protein